MITVKSSIADAIITNGISALEISTKLEELSEKAKEQIAPKFEKYGFSVVNFFIQSINFPDEDFEKINKILEDKAAFEIMGDGRYSTKRSFDVYESAASNESCCPYRVRETEGTADRDDRSACRLDSRAPAGPGTEEDGDSSGAARLSGSSDLCQRRAGRARVHAVGSSGTGGEGMCCRDRLLSLFGGSYRRSVRASPPSSTP